MKHLTHSFIISLILIIITIRPGSCQQEQPHTVFWEISGNNLKQNSWLFGTIHIMPKKEFIRFPIADSVLKTSDLLILEMDIDVPLRVQMEWAGKLILPENKRIPDFMEEEDFTRLKSYSLDSLNIKEVLFNNYLKLKPFAFYSALIPHAIGKKIEGYDIYFNKIAKKKNIPVHGLETFDFQMGIFDSISNDAQLKMFFSEIPDLKKELYEVMELYKEQDIYKMATSLEEEGGEYAKIEEELLILRNKNWAAALDTLLSDQQCFMAVGAAHLAGENGLITLLREKGYIVRGIALKEE